MTEFDLRRLKMAQDLAQGSVTDARGESPDVFLSGPSRSAGLEGDDQIESVEARHRRIEAALRERIGGEIPPVILQVRRIIAVLLSEQSLAQPLDHYLEEVRVAIADQRKAFTPLTPPIDADVKRGTALVFEGLEALTGALQILQTCRGDMVRLVEADALVSEAGRFFAEARDSVVHRADLLEES